MIILETHSNILKYSFDLSIFKRNFEINQSQYTSSHWRNGKDDTVHLDYNVFFNAKHPHGEEYFLNFQSRLYLHCKISNLEEDAAYIISRKEILNVSAQLFLMQNTQNYYYFLNFHEMNLTDESNTHNNPARENEIRREIDNLERVLHSDL